MLRWLSRLQIAQKARMQSMTEQIPTLTPDPSPSTATGMTSQAINLKREADPESWIADGKRLKVGSIDTVDATPSVDNGMSEREQASASTSAAADVVMAELNDDGRGGNQLSSAEKPQSEMTEGVDSLAAPDSQLEAGSSTPTPVTASGSPAAAKKKEKKERNAGRRRGARGAPWGPKDASAANSTTEDGNSAEKTPRLPKRQCALLIGYCGSGCSGMQIQPGQRTIEGLLFTALVRAGAVSADNADDPTKVNLQRAARTDAGVHAAGNVVSMKIITNPTGVPDLVARVNEELPKELRLWSFLRVQNSFNARTYLLIPPKPGSGLARTFASQSSSLLTSSTESDDNRAIPNSSEHPFWASAGPGSREEDMVRKKKWRVNMEVVASLREAAKKYEGTHNFHNFTVGRDFKERSCNRYMKKIEISDPIVYGETEWVSVMLHGQSFMLHQRKMMCVLVMLVRTGTPARIIEELYKSRQVTVPKMPSLGLLLEQPIFESYSKRMIDNNVSKGLSESLADYRPAIEFEIHREKIERFKDEQIYSRMRASEEKAEVFDRWVHQIDRYAGQDLLYYNMQGVVPDEAVVKRGVTRSNAFREKRRFDATEFSADEPALALGDDDAAADEVDEEKEAQGMGKKELEEAEG